MAHLRFHTLMLSLALLGGALLGRSAEAAEINLTPFHLGYMRFERSGISGGGFAGRYLPELGFDEEAAPLTLGLDIGYVSVNHDGKNFGTLETGFFVGYRFNDSWAIRALLGMQHWAREDGGSHLYAGPMLEYSVKHFTYLDHVFVAATPCFQDRFAQEYSAGVGFRF